MLSANFGVTFVVETLNFIESGASASDSEPEEDASSKSKRTRCSGLFLVISIISGFVSLTFFEDSSSALGTILLLLVVVALELLISFQMSSSDRNLVRLNILSILHSIFMFS